MKTQKKASYPHTPELAEPEQAGEERLITLVGLWKHGRATINDVVREFYACARVRRIARHVAREAGLESSIEEAVQLVADRFFTEGIMDTIYDEKNLYSLLYTVAINAIRQEAESNLRWNRKHERVHEDGPGIEELQTVADFSGDVLHKINRDRSAQELMRRLGNKPNKGQTMETYNLANSIGQFQKGIELIAETSPARVSNKVSRLGPKDESALPADARELREIRKQLGYKVPDMARSINISRDKMSAALYGRLIPVPAAIMRDARDLLSASQAAISAREAKFKRFKNMEELVKFWLKELELEENRKGEEELAVILGVNHSTVFRWCKEEYKPLLADLDRYDHNVRVAVEHRKLIRATMAREGRQEAVKPRRKSVGSRKQASPT